MAKRKHTIEVENKLEVQDYIDQDKNITNTPSRKLIKGKGSYMTQKKKQTALVNKYYGVYKKKIEKEVGRQGFAQVGMTKREFKESLTHRNLRTSISKFVNKQVSVSLDQLTRNEALNIKQAAQDFGIDISGMKLDDIRKDKALQHEIYTRLQNMSTTDKTDWWTENIIGSD